MTSSPTPAVLSDARGLLPCPFCGGSAIEAETHAKGEWFYGVDCVNCGAQVHESDPQRSALLWNQRATPPASDAAAPAGEVVAWRFEEQPFQGGRWTTYFSSKMPHASRFRREITPLYAAAPKVASDTADEAIRLAYKTGHTAGYIDATDDGSGKGYCDHDAAEEGWQQYKEKLDAEAVHIDAPVSTDGAHDLFGDGGDVDAARPVRMHCGLACGYDCNYPDGCVVAPKVASEAGARLREELEQVVLMCEDAAYGCGSCSETCGPVKAVNEIHASVTAALTHPAPSESATRADHAQGGGEVDDVVGRAKAMAARGGPHEWGYRDVATGEFIHDEWPFFAADLLATTGGDALEQAAIKEALERIANGLPGVRAPHRFSFAREIAQRALSARNQTDDGGEK